MILTVTTAKDTPANLAAYCRRNLAGGADHLLVFLDGPDAAAEEFLAQQEHVTYVVTGDEYWTPRRPPNLNTRQLVNANLANALLAGFDWAQWLFHIDADESLQIDADRLADVSAPLVRIMPIEAVSQLHWDGEVTHFKPMLTPREIARLVKAGLIDEPEPGEHPNSTWFSGHVKGKLGVRPDPGVHLELHHGFAYDDPETELAAFEAPWLEHRHYESHSGSEFVRKWLAHLDAGPIRLRPSRRRLMEQIAAIVGDEGLDEPARAAALEGLYRREVQDDLPALEAAGVLVAPVERDHRPEAFPAADREVFETLLDKLVRSDKRAFNVKRAEQPVPLLRTMRAELSDTDPGAGPLAVVLDRALAHADAAATARAAGPRRRFGLRRG